MVELITIDMLNEQGYNPMKIQVLDYGFLRLDAALATDLSVVNSARVSFNKHVDFVSDPDVKVIDFLMRNRHGTPFEHNMFRFHVCCPIFVAREWQRHRIGSYNELSARYTELPELYYIPRPENVRTRVGKPGAYSYEPHPNPRAFIDDLDRQCRSSYQHYRVALDDGIAPEQARLFLHVNHYTEFYWSVNARSMMNFLNLRNHETAQQEIREYAKIVEQRFEELMPYTCLSFVRNGRVAP